MNWRPDCQLPTLLPNVRTWELGFGDWELSGCGPPRPGAPAAHCRVYLALLPSGPDAVRRLELHRVRAAMRRTHGRAHRRAPQILRVTYGHGSAKAGSKGAGTGSG